MAQWQRICLPTKEMQEMSFQSLSREDPLEGGAWQPTPAFLPGESHGQRRLVGHSSWGHKESDMTERLSTYKHLREWF